MSEQKQSGEEIVEESVDELRRKVEIMEKEHNAAFLEMMRKLDDKSSQEVDDVAKTKEEELELLKRKVKDMKERRAS